MSTNTKKITKATLLVVLATIFTKIFGFLREVVLGAFYGTSYKLDSLIAAQLLPGVFFASIMASFSTTFIPIYNEISVKKGKNRANKFVNNALVIIIVLATVVAIIGCILSPYIVGIVFNGFDAEKRRLTSTLMRITFFYIIFLGSNYIFQGFLQSNENFVVPVLVSLPFNAVIIASAFLKKEFDIYAVAVAFVIGYFSMVLFQIPFARKKGFKFNFDFSLNDEYITKMFRLVLPVFIGSSVMSLNSFVDRYLASHLQEGSISALNYADKLNGLVYGIFSASISTVIYPYLSRFFSSDNKEEFKKYLNLSINSLIIIMVPITFGVFFLSNDIVTIVYERGAFDKRSTLLTSGALMFFSLGYLGYSIRDILSRTFYSVQDTLTPMKNGILAVCINIILNIILVRFMQHRGLALGTSIVSYISVFLLLKGLVKKIGRIDLKNSIIVFVKTLISSFAMIIFVHITKTFAYVDFKPVFLSRLLNLILEVGVGAFVYFLMIYFMKIYEVRWLMNNSKEIVSKVRGLIAK